jgi:hypothetical protein
MVYRYIIFDPKPHFWVQNDTSLPILRDQRPDCAGISP